MRRWWVGVAALGSLLFVAPVVAQARDCAGFEGLAIPPERIGLPVGGALVTGAEARPASGAVGAYCHVTAQIASLDPAAPPIRLEVNLPEGWNGKALMYGGGGFNGSILSSPGRIRLQPPDVATPLGRGYATFGSDSGHQGPSTDGSFAMNDEALRNYAFEALKKTHDAAVFLIGERYGRAPEKLYFHGSSNGGKEALAMIQRYPADLDGAMIFWPAPNALPLALQFSRISRALMAPGAYPSLAERATLLAAAMRACDGLDGAEDRLISDSRGCQGRFDPSGVLPGPQVAALWVMETPIDLSGVLGAGVRYPGFNAWGADWGSRTDDETAKLITAQGLGTEAPGLPVTDAMPFMANFADNFWKYFVARDRNLDWRGIDPEHPGRWRARLAELASLLDQDRTDLSAFARRGGKVILLHGMADEIIPVQGTEQYYEAVVRTMGREAVAGFLRFYELPGTEHSGVGTAFTPTWDVLGALDRWVVAGEAPTRPVVVDQYAAKGRSRPLCEYPAWPRYREFGDLSRADSFECAR